MKKRTRRKVRPLINPLHIMENMQPLGTYGSQNVTWAVQTRLALDACLMGTGTREDVCTLLASSRMVHAIAKAGLGADYIEQAQAAMDACNRLSKRHAATKSSAMNHEDREALKTMCELHDQQLENMTVGESQAALAAAVKQLQRDIEEKRV